jgi:phosphohistidine swiveling domain-containing protein
VEIMNKIASIDWLSRWAGSYTFISCSHWGRQYFYTLYKILGQNFKQTLFVHRKGVVTFYVTRDEFEQLGQTQARKSEKSLAYARKLNSNLQKSTDVLLPMMKILAKKIPTTLEYNRFLKVFERHLAFHVYNKKTVDFISNKKANALMPIFGKARLYSEDVYSQSEHFFRSIMKLISKKENVSAKNLTCLTQEEFEEYLTHGTLPNVKTLSARYELSLLFFYKGKRNILLGNSVTKVENLITKSKSKDKELRGITAYPGKAIGRARIILDPHLVTDFKKGDILITGMTRPEFLPLIKKSAAIITDVGGVLSHAAISARELKKPCIVGTGTATRNIKNNSKLVVDADNGNIRIL